jgi:hypothetical protein
MSWDQRRWIMRLRKRIEQESDPCILFELWWELDRLLSQSAIQPPPIPPSVVRSARASLPESNPYLLFKSSAQIPALLLSAIEATGADFGNVQLFDASNQELRIVAQQGFGSGFLTYFERVLPRSCSCGEALNRGSRVVVPDVGSDPLFRDRQTQDVMQRAHVRSVQSTPLFNRSGKLIGVVSTHFDRPRGFPPNLLERMDEIIAGYVIPLQCPLSIETKGGR